MTGKDNASLVFVIQTIYVSKTDLIYLLYKFHECISHYIAAGIAQPAFKTKLKGCFTSFTSLGNLSEHIQGVPSIEIRPFVVNRRSYTFRNLFV